MISENGQISEAVADQLAEANRQRRRAGVLAERLRTLRAIVGVEDDAMLYVKVAERFNAVNDPATPSAQGDGDPQIEAPTGE